MAITNPCGLSVQDTVKIIKENVLNGKYNGRNDMMKGLMNDPTLNLQYSEAKQVTDYYYSIYRKIANQNKTSGPVIHLDAEQKTQRQVNNLALDYLSGNTGGVPLTDADINHLQSLYEQADKAETPSLKAKFDEQANVFLAKFLPNYSTELFRSSVYARPLLSSVFFIKSLTSNLHAQVERTISNIIWDGKKADFTWLGKFQGLANATFVDVIKGGIPATTIAHNEHFDFSKGRLEESDFKGSTLESAGKLKKGYFGLMKFYTKWSNRFNAAPDTRGIYSNAERHMYQLLKEKYRDEGLTDEDATQKAIEDMELDDKDTATRMAEAKFKELGLPIENKRGKPTSEFKVAVQEYQRLKRDNVIWAKALELSKNDFWKKNMTVATELGFGDYGIFGVIAQFYQALKSKLESQTKGKVSAAFSLYAFGFLNGAANFAEDAIERFPLYGLTKYLFLQARKGNVTDQELVHDIARRQKDLIVKNVTTAMFFVGMKMMENLICGDKKNKQSTKELSETTTSIGPCGIPVLVPPQMMAIYKVYNMIDKATDSDEDFFNTVLTILPVMAQSNEMGLGGSFDKMATTIGKYSAAVVAGNKVQQEEAEAKLTKETTRMAADVANSFLPIPSRMLNETGTVIERAKGQSQRQQDINFAINEKGNPKGWFNTLGKITIANLGNVTGVSEIMIAGFGSNKPYAMDWQGRKVVQLRGSDITGNGVQYNKNDELLIDAGVAPPYVSRQEKIEYANTKTDTKGFLDVPVEFSDKKVRYMTDNEYYNVSKALADFNKEYFKDNYDEIKSSLDTNEKVARKQINTVFSRTKDKAIEAIEKGLKTPEEILEYVKENWPPQREQKLTETNY